MLPKVKLAQVVTPAPTSKRGKRSVSQTSEASGGCGSAERGGKGGPERPPSGSGEGTQENPPKKAKKAGSPAASTGGPVTLGAATKAHSSSKLADQAGRGYGASSSVAVAEPPKNKGGSTKAPGSTAGTSSAGGGAKSKEGAGPTWPWPMTAAGPSGSGGAKGPKEVTGRGTAGGSDVTAKGKGGTEGIPPTTTGPSGVGGSRVGGRKDSHPAREEALPGKSTSGGPGGTKKADGGLEARLMRSPRAGVRPPCYCSPLHPQGEERLPSRGTLQMLLPEGEDRVG